MLAIGMDPYFDTVGNLYGRIEGIQEKQVILTGSHIDTVVNGGKYDGAYGVIASLLATKMLFEQYGRPHKTIEVVSLCEEEGSRFPLTYWGSKNITGEYSLQDIKQLKDGNGILFQDAMGKAGFPSTSYISNKRNDIDHFIEVHIEQGAILEKNKIDIGLVTHIVGQRRYTIQFIGESNHAGTTPMEERKDPMVCAANCIDVLTKIAKEDYPGLRATVGSINAEPNVSNVVPKAVSITLDVRHHEDYTLEKYSDEVLQMMTEKADESGIVCKVDKWADSQPVALNTSLHSTMEKIAKNNGLNSLQMVSGAGHDSQILGAHYPTTLFFVPSQKGISHSPLEFTKVQDLENGILLLKEVLYKLAYEGVH
jgi:allantoate deiminase